MNSPTLPPAGAPDIEIARAAAMQPILELTKSKYKIPQDALVPYGHHKAKLSLDFIKKQSKQGKKGKLVLVTAMNPTPAGEGKTTTSIGLNDGLNKIGQNSIVCLREPSLGPCFGVKGGAAGGGRSQVVPMEDINLHFNGDFHAITSAHNLLSAIIDNHLHWGNQQNIDTRRVFWRRVVDMNDRALRSINIGLGGANNGIPRETGFDITVASEIMAILCLSEGLSDMRARLSRIIIGQTYDKDPVRAGDLGAEGPMAVLLKDALQPNIVQSIENNIAFIHGGPFANIAHGCNSVIATKAALSLADIVVTEAGFGADLGAEKFFNIKCRQSGLRPDVVVLVCTVRALKMHAGVAKRDLSVADPAAVRKGGENLHQHIENLQKFGIRPIVAINHFDGDTDAEVAEIRKICDGFGCRAEIAKHWASGGEGAVTLATVVKEALSASNADIRLTYDDNISLAAKVETIAKEIYRAETISFSASVKRRLREFENWGFGNLPICIAKTQYSFSTDAAALGAPKGHCVEVRDVRLSAGAGFVVAICGPVMTMPGLPEQPAALQMGLDENGEIYGLA
ncbi:MAG: formate--tetrahydrofolate ligase [Pseudomonadota bacterium]